MLYRILKFIMKRSLRAHYLEIKGTGFSNIPSKGPLLIAANHPNSFLDAIILAVHIHRPIHFLARSDVFKKKWSNYILRKMNLIPIYRLQEGSENLSKNERTFQECNEILKNEGAILIFVEGVSIIDKKLRPLKKGLARIAFDYMQQTQFQKPLNIAPISINYDRPTTFRSKVLIGVGDIINAADFKEDFTQNPNKAYNQLNSRLFVELKNHTIEVEEENQLVYKAITELDSCYQENSLNRKILIANHIAEFNQKSSSEYQQLSNYSKNALEILNGYELNFRKLKVNDGLQWKRLLMFLLGTPLAAFSLLLHLFPYLITKWISNSKVKLIEFYASVRLVLGTILWIIWTLSITLIGIYYSNWFILYPLFSYFSLKFLLWYNEEAKYDSAVLKLFRLKKNKTDYKRIAKYY